jgi:hypothetical protein
MLSTEKLSHVVMLAALATLTAAVLLLLMPRTASGRVCGNCLVESGESCEPAEDRMLDLTVTEHRPTDLATSARLLLDGLDDLD